MAIDHTLVVVGASLAGAKAAEAAREAGFDGRLVVIGDEQARPYERPPLSKGILRGDDATDAAQVHPDSFYDEHAIELVDGPVTVLDTAARTVRLARGDTIRFDTAIMATGAAPRRLTVPGADLDGVHYLRTLDDALRLRDAIRGAGRVAVIGAGWIGSEVAASARQMGAEVVLVDPGRVPLRRVVGDDVGAVFRSLHAEHGVELRLGARLTELRGIERVEAVVLDDGRVESADVVVVGIGVTPRTELADAAVGMRVDNGIVVDQHLETSVAGIYAAGDVANAWHPHYQRHLRVEHWSNALNQGLVAGRNAAGRRESYDRVPYFFSDQYDLGLEYVGDSRSDDAVVVRGDLKRREFIALWHHDGSVTAAMSVNVWDVIDELKAVVASRRPIEEVSSQFV